jgi:hypothetical protein
MMSKEFLKKLGILGVSFGLLASPLAFADFHDEEEEEPIPEEETFPEENGNASLTSGFDGIEYENEEEEWEVPDEEEEFEEYEEEEEKEKEKDEEEDEPAW